ncbi:hypothetical protein J6590_067206 [Homalodisca vitripennis]|nr:hypothetical protein J6590_067206 [Homalodisca vitripennis]
MANIHRYQPEQPEPDNWIKQRQAWLLLGWVTAKRSCPCKQPACPAIGGGSEVIFMPISVPSSDPGNYSLSETNRRRAGGDNLTHFPGLFKTGSACHRLGLTDDYTPTLLTITHTNESAESPIQKAFLELYKS